MNATKYPPPCVQPVPGQNRIVGDEDCLALNIYTPDLPSGTEGIYVYYVINIISLSPKFYTRSTGNHIHPRRRIQIWISVTIWGKLLPNINNSICTIYRPFVLFIGQTSHKTRLACGLYPVSFGIVGFPKFRLQAIAWKCRTVGHGFGREMGQKLHWILRGKPSQNYRLGSRHRS